MTDDAHDPDQPLYFDASRLFDYLLTEYDVDPATTSMEWSFHFQANISMSDDEIELLLESLDSIVEADDDSLHAELNEASEVQDPSIPCSELTLIFTGIMTEPQLAMAHSKFVAATENLPGWEYGGVSCQQENGELSLVGIASWTDTVLADSADWKISELDEIATPMRTTHLNRLNELGLTAASWMPNAAQRGFIRLRPQSEIIKRLMAASAAVAWVCAPEEIVPDEEIEKYLTDNRLLNSSFSVQERQWMELPREAAAEYQGQAGWLTENIWSLAWLLGFPTTPNPCPQQVTTEIMGPIRDKFLRRFERRHDDMLASTTLRPLELVIALEDLLYCAHNAMRTIGNVETIGLVQERRQPLTWALSPGVKWDDTDVST